MKKEFGYTKTKYCYSQEKVKVKWGEQENDIRNNWPRRSHYIMTTFGFIIGTGDLAAFPRECLKYGGLVYIVMYMLALAVLGMPLALLELAIGQYTSQGPATCWKMAPLFHGIGVGMLINSLTYAYYYNLFIAWNLGQIMACFIHPLPWTKCNNDYNTPYCHNGQYMHSISQRECIEQNMTAASNGICYVNKTTLYGFWDVSITENQPNISTNFYAAPEYFNRKMFQQNDEVDFENIGSFLWETTLFFIFSWIINYIANFGGLKTSGNVAYFTASFPFIAGTIFAVYFATLDGGAQGVAEIYNQVDWTYLYDIDAWNSATTRVLYSLAISWGGFVMLASYNPFHNNILKDMFIFTLGDLFMQLMATIMVYAMYGYLNTIEAIASNGNENIYDIYLNAAILIGHLPSANFTAFLYCIFLFTLAVDSQFVAVEIVFTSVLDLIPSLHSRRRIFVTISTVVLACVGLPLCTQGGRYIFEFLDTYTASEIVLLLSLLEIICVGWVYGTDNFGQDISLMMGNQKVFGMLWPRWSKYFTLCWKFLTPGCLLFIACTTFTKASVLTYGDYIYPSWSLTLGLAISFISLGAFVITTIKILLSKKSGPTLKIRMKRLLQPDQFWGPSLVRHRVKVGHLKNFDIDPFWLGPDNPILHGGTFDTHNSYA